MVRRLKEDQKIAKVKLVKFRLYHLSWANPKAVWQLVDWDEEKDIAKMVTPKTNKSLTTKLSSLRNTKKTKEKEKKERRIRRYINNEFAPKEYDCNQNDNLDLLEEPDPF